MWKKTFAPHTNITATMPRGMSVQASSRASDPWISAGRSSSERRRYLTAKKTSATEIADREDDRHRDDEEEEGVHLAREGGGALGKEGERRAHCGVVPRRRAGRGQDEAAEGGDGQEASEPHEVEDRGAVAAGLGVVLVAVEQDLVDGGADLPARRVHQREAEVLRRVLDAEEVVGDLPLGGRHEDPGGVGELLRLHVPHVAEADRLREAVHGLLRPGQEVPALVGPRPLVAGHVGLLLRRGEDRPLLRVEADGQDLELLPGHEGEHLERPRQAVQAERAEHRAVVVDEAQDDGLLPEVVAELHVLPRLVLEGEVQGDRVAQLLVEPDLLEDAGRRRHRRRRHRAHLGGGERREGEEECRGERAARHLVPPAGAGVGSGPGNFGRPRAATIFIASSTGMRATALSFSTQP